MKALTILKTAFYLLIFATLSYPFNQDIFGCSYIVAFILFIIGSIKFSRE